jgi:hypothetical protein
MSVLGQKQSFSQCPLCAISDRSPDRFCPNLLMTPRYLGLVVTSTSVKAAIS